MDLDTPASAITADFSTRYPLPFRVLGLSFATLLGFATNLHLLAFLGIDTALVLDIRLDEYLHLSQSTRARHVHPSRLYPPIYALATLGLLWTFCGWAVFQFITAGSPTAMVRWRGVPLFIALVCGAGCVAPWNFLFKRERMMYLRALRRTVFGTLYSAVPFSDIILADILTSSAKVLGDVWVSGCLVFTETEKFSFGVRGGASGCAREIMVPIMISLPYLFRLRQCLAEVVSGSTPTPARSLANALKYASAFPVIIASAMQTVVGDPYDQEPLDESNVWIGKTGLFRIWVLAVFVNSLYSFWWDVTNDWGLSLLTRSGWSTSPTVSYAFVNPPTAHARRTRARSNPSSPQQATGGRNRGAHSVSTPEVRSSSSGLSVPGAEASLAYPPPPSRPGSPVHVSSPAKGYHAPAMGRSSHSRAFSTAAQPNVTFPFLRPIMLLPDPVIYYLAIAVDLVLRFTWSLKLSSHLHTIHEIESGVFLMEALEVVRRWMWVYLRIEWEAVRKGSGGLSSTEDYDVEEEGYRDAPKEDEEIGLGILVLNDRAADSGKAV